MNVAREPRRYARPHFKTPIPSSDVMNCRVCSHLSVRRSSILATTFGCVGLSSWRNGSRSSSRGLCIPGLAMGRRRSLLGPARAEGTEAYSSWSNLSAGIRRNNLETWSRLSGAAVFKEKVDVTSERTSAEPVNKDITCATVKRQLSRLCPMRKSGRV